MSNIAVVGDKASVLAFKALGIDVFTPIGAEESRRTVDSLARKGYAVIFITEEIVEKIEETVNRYDHELLPAVIPIPSSQGNLGIGRRRVEENLEKAVGFNLFREDDET